MEQKLNSRRSFLKSAALLSVSPFLLNSCKNAQNHSQKPNIIYILADDLGYGDIGCYGQEHIQTPNIDKMAKQGIRFTQHYAGNTVCAPSRCSLMTGFHMGHAEIRGNKQAETSGQLPISDEAVTVAELLKSAGYKTGMMGKWGLGNAGTTGDPNEHGFDHYFGYLDQVLAHNYYPEYLIRNGEKVMLSNEVKYLDKSQWHKGLGSYTTKKEEYSHDLFMNEAIEYIEKNKNNSFFLYLPFTIPHENGEAPLGEKMEVPDQGIYKNKNWDKDSKDYAAMISRMDKDVGIIIQKLKELNLDENTLVIFTSDNGPMPNESFSNFFNSNGRLRGGKRDLYEGGIRMPMVAYWQGKIKQGTETNHISAFWDFLPTACDIAGVKTPENIDGISFLPTLLSNTEKQTEHEFLYWEYHTGKYTKQAVRYKNWKLVKHDPSGPVELFDLNIDIEEKNDISQEHPEILQKTERMFEDRTDSKHFELRQSKI